MPLLHIRTNKTLDNDIKSGLLKTASTTVTGLLGKSEQYVMVSIDDQVAMSFAGNRGECAYLELKSIGLPESETTRLSAALCQLIEEQLGITGDRVYIEFANAERHLWGWNGKTF